MAQVRKVAKSSITYFCETGFNRLADVLIFLWINRYLLPDDFGLYAYVFSYLGFFASISDLGMSVILQRETARDESGAPRLMGAGFATGLATVLILGTVSLVIGKLGGNGNEFKAILIALPYILITSKIYSFRQLLETVYIVNFRMSYKLISNVLGRIVFIVWLYWIVANNGDVFDVIIAATYCDLPGFLILGTMYLRLFPRPTFDFDFKLVKRLISYAFPLLVGNIAYVINMSIGIIFLKFLLTNADVAIYFSANRMVMFLSFVSLAFIIPVGPVLSKKFVENREAFFNVFTIAMKYLFYFIVPLTLLFALYYDKVVLVLRPEYIVSVKYARIMAGYQILIGMFSAVTYILVYSDYQKYVTRIHIISSITALLLTGIITKLYGLTGASYAFLLSSGVFIPVSYCFKPIRQFIDILLKILWRPLVASAGIVLLYIFIPDNIVFVVTAGLIAYLVLLVLVRGFNRRDREVLNELLGR